MVYKPLPHILIHLNFDPYNNLVKGRLIIYILWVWKLRLREAKWIIEDHEDCRVLTFNLTPILNFKKKSAKSDKWPMSGGIRMSFCWFVCEGLSLLLRGLEVWENCSIPVRALRMGPAALRSQDIRYCMNWWGHCEWKYFIDHYLHEQRGWEKLETKILTGISNSKKICNEDKSSVKW